MSNFQNIQPSGGSTGVELNLQRRFALMTQYIDLKDKHIVDCGCGSGDYVMKFLEYSPHVRGVEYSADKVEEFRSRACHPESVAQGDIENLEFRDHTFDVVLLNEVLEHVPNDRRALQEAHRVLKPRGFLVVFSPNRLYPFETHATTFKLGKKEIPHYVPLVPYIPLWLGSRILLYHARNYFPWGLAKMIEKAGFQIIKQTAIWQTFENISGNSPIPKRLLRPVLRAISFSFEKIPLIKFLGVSQVIFAVKP